MSLLFALLLDDKWLFYIFARNVHTEAYTAHYSIIKGWNNIEKTNVLK